MTTTDIVERLRSKEPLVICPYDPKSPEYLTTPDDAPCKFCGGLSDGPDLCKGVDLRILGEAADEIERLRSALEQIEENGNAPEMREIATCALAEGVT
jgi:hypothetical protein